VILDVVKCNVWLLIYMYIHVSVILCLLLPLANKDCCYNLVIIIIWCMLVVGMDGKDGGTRR